MATRFLLPNYRDELNSTVPYSTWGEFDRDFFKLDEILESNFKIKEVSSIPSPWARLLLAKDALSETHVLNDKISIEILDLLEMIFFQEILDFNIRIKKVNLSDETSNIFQKAMFSLGRQIFGEEGNFLEEFQLFYAEFPNSEDIIALGGSSPYSLVLFVRVLYCFWFVRGSGGRGSFRVCGGIGFFLLLRLVLFLCLG